MADKLLESTQFDPAAGRQMQTLLHDLGRMYQERNDALQEVVRAHHETLFLLALAAGASIAIVAAGMGSSAFLPALWRLQALRGQVTVGLADNAAALPPFPVNGSGNLVPQVPGPDGAFWVMGSTFERDVSALPVSAADQASAHAHNLGKLAQLLPATAQQLQAAFTPGDPACQPTWARVRVASHDRLPIVGPVLPRSEERRVGKECRSRW